MDAKVNQIRSTSNGRERKIGEIERELFLRPSSDADALHRLYRSSIECPPETLFFCSPSPFGPQVAKKTYFGRTEVQLSLVPTDSFRQNADECCETGRIQAESTNLCTSTFESLSTNQSTNGSAHCRFLSHICCLANLRNYYCEEGLKTALRLLPCNETKLESKDTYQVRVARRQESRGGRGDLSL